MVNSSGFDARRWDEYAEILEEALSLPSERRAAFLAQRLPGDDEAQREVQDLLVASDADAVPEIERHMVRDVPLLAEPLPVGSRIGAYRVVARIGEGGMGEVYRAERVDGPFEQAVAIKVLRSGLGATELVRRFHEERRILARLTHPGIVGILDGGTTVDGRPYLVMPFVEGASITEWCTTSNATLEQRLTLILDVAAAVQHAHTALVVHRDIKPSNILVSPAGDVRLLDFGIAKWLEGSDRPDDDNTRSALRLLTPEHAAPEQVRGEAVSTATDVYGLGILLYELLTGDRPFRRRGRSLRDLEQDILELAPALPSVAGSGRPWAKRLRGDLDRIVLQALRKEPGRRYASVGQFADDITRYLKGLPVSAERDRWSYRMRKFVQRNRVGVGIGGTALVLLIAFAVGMAVQARQLERERDRAQREEGTARSMLQLMASFFERANPTVVPGGDTLRVQQLLALGDTLVDSLVDQPYLQARMWKVLGTVQLARGRTEEAERALARSYEKLQALEGTDSLEVAWTYHELARAVHGHAGRARSLPMFEQSVARLERAPGISPIDIATARRELAEQMLDRDAARQVLERETQPRIMRTASDSMEYASALNALANQRYGDGRLREALALFEETVRVLDGQLPPDHPNQLLVRGNVATMLRDLGEYGRAEAMARELLEAQRKQVTTNPLALAAAMEHLAGTQAMRGYLEDAERGYDEAVAIELNGLASAHTMMVWNRYSQAVVRGARGRAQEAIATLDSVLAMMRRGGFTNTDTLTATDLQAAYLIEQGRFQKAGQALARTRPVLASKEVAYRLGHEAHAQLEGIVSLGERRGEDALRWFDMARQSQRRRLPDTHPEALGNECGRGAALALLGDRTRALPMLREACAGYRRYGLHMRQLLRLGLEAQRALEAQPAAAIR